MGDFEARGPVDFLFNLTMQSALDAAHELRLDDPFIVASLYANMEAVYREEVYDDGGFGAEDELRSSLYEAALFEVDWRDVCLLDAKVVKNARGAAVSKLEEEGVGLKLSSRNGFYYGVSNDGGRGHFSGRSADEVYAKAISVRKSEIESRGRDARGDLTGKVVFGDFDLACDYFKTQV